MWQPSRTAPLPTLLLLLAPTAAAHDEEVIRLPAAIATTSVPSGRTPPLEMIDGDANSGATWRAPDAHLIDNIPNAFADAALGGTDGEALVIGPPGRWTPRVGMQYVTEGVGYTDSFLFASGFIPWGYKTGGEHSLSFLEATGGAANNDEVVGAVEWVDRDYTEGKGRVSGDYFAIDYRDSEFGGYRQIAFGEDKLGASRESRWNLYLPLGRNQKVLSTERIRVPVGSAVLPAVRTNYETALYGADLEWGWRILPLDQCGLWWLLGGYHFQAGGVEQVWGVKTRLELRLWRSARMSVEYQRDDAFDDNLVFAAEYSLPGAKPRGRPDDAYITDRLGESVRRWRHITLARSSSSTFF